jgi:hypothetical protein
LRQNFKNSSGQPNSDGNWRKKVRGVERQELRFKSYGALWKKLRPLAIYDREKIDLKSVQQLSLDLSDWYFSECGGLFLTVQVRDFYFALQDLLREVSRIEDWVAERSLEDERELVRTVLKNKNSKALDVFEYFTARDFRDWHDNAGALAANWRSSIREIAKDWNGLKPHERFAVLQQVGSLLRTSLTNDTESRLQ